ncbi:hypothetical protein FA13DRAFT_258836 [Coprinellus micaceus]|uniref:F-box domain-containing protein n=1 Tax=Coprinellus micaceus TaxID=71717 RepID=A0A4Y7TEY6_COPMI|nr:hypothetical protein FA13DRAFT_258836 [Coprinellus micaceus]
MQYLTREVRPQDVERYTTVYAPRIRSVQLGSRLAPSIGVLQGLSIATRFIPGALSPNIRALSWSVYAFDYLGMENVDLAASYMSLFAGETLSCLYIPPLPEAPLPLCFTALFSTIERLSGLKVLDLRSTFSPPNNPDVLNKLIASCPWECLESLDVPTVAESVLGQLQTLPRLKSLGLWGQQDILPLRYTLGRPPTYPPPTSFASLETLVVQSRSLGLLLTIALLQHLPQVNRFRSLITSTWGESSPESSDVTQDFFCGHWEPL